MFPLALLYLKARKIFPPKVQQKITFTFVKGT